MKRYCSLQSIYSIDLISRRYLKTFPDFFENILQKYFPHTDATSRRPHRRPDGRLDEATQRRRRRPRSERRLRRQQLPVQWSDVHPTLRRRKTPTEASRQDHLVHVSGWAGLLNVLSIIRRVHVGVPRIQKFIIALSYGLETCKVLVSSEILSIFIRCQIF